MSVRINIPAQTPDYARTLMQQGIQPNLPLKGTRVRVHFCRKWFTERTEYPKMKLSIVKQKVLRETFTLPTFGDLVVIPQVQSKIRGLINLDPGTIDEDTASFDGIVTGFKGGDVYGTNTRPIVFVRIVE